MKRVSKEELAGIIERHGRWLRAEDGGEQADLRKAILCRADLSGTDLSGTDLTGARL